MGAMIAPNGDPGGLGTNDLSSRAGGFAGALDYHVTRDSVIGVALAGGETNWGLAGGLGGGRSNALQTGVYGATHNGPAYLAGTLAYTWHAASTDRSAVAGDELTARFNAQSYGGRVESGYRLGWPMGAVTPYAALQSQGFSTPPTRRPTSAAAVSGLLSRRGPRPIPGASWAPVSTARSRLIRIPFWRCGHGSPGPMIG